MTYIVLAQSPKTGYMFRAVIRDCTYKDIRERFFDRYGDYDEGFVIISITEISKYV